MFAVAGVSAAAVSCGGPSFGLLDGLGGEGLEFADQLACSTWSDGRVPSLRWILCHMIEEYARHNDHADLMRESVDGETGE